MSYSVRLTDDAARDLDELFAHSLSMRKGLGPDLLLDRIQSAFEHLEETPIPAPKPSELLALGDHGYREHRAPPVRIIYRVAAEEVHVLLIGDEQRAMQSLLQRRLLEG